MSFRAQRSARMLAEDSSITFEEMIRYKHSTRMELADRILEPLIAAAEDSRNEAAKTGAQPQRGGENRRENSRRLGPVRGRGQPRRGAV